MAKKKWQKRTKATVAFVFTHETLQLTLKALALLGEPLNRADHLDEKIVFAEETVQRVKHKLELMQQSVGALCLTTFDYNEKVIIRNAMLLYSIELLETPASLKRAKELRQCRYISTHLTDNKRSLL